MRRRPTAARAVEGDYAQLVARLYDRDQGVLANVLDPFHADTSSQPARDACASFAEAAETLGHNHSTPMAPDSGVTPATDDDADVPPDVFAHLAHVAGDDSDDATPWTVALLSQTLTS